MKGQFFTKSIILKQKVYEFIQNKPKIILEPSVGRGDLIYYLRDKIDCKYDLYEIDPNINDFLIDKKKIKFCDFLKQEITKKYDTIIGNPPYVRTKKGNLYIDFIEKCYNLLNDKGELIFIIPSDFFKLTSATKLLNIMLKNGSFTHIFHPNNEKLFEKASIDIIVFRYCKNIFVNKIIYNNNDVYGINSNGMLLFSNNKMTNNKFVFDYFDIFVGFVSGKDDVFHNEKIGNVEILWDINIKKKFIMIDKFPSTNKNINELLLENKEILKKRKIRNFNNNNWFEWGALRNKHFIDSNIGKPCIYLRNMSRKNIIAMKSTVGYFGAGLFMLFPKSDEINLDIIVDYFNSDNFRQYFTYSNRFKINHNQLYRSIIKKN
ncbi:putative adenine specific DNA methyltransferase [Bodo saltans virus]|uniref:site-specific DNA-methyltransferase (adenine-specific) n=1 Tax=Bodo saltans virus TaxID=2024608 RepID=A0A2H4UTH8_9VIRU|nr:putative adenine specific DNA methyltransferase [Bodo saltans virus]ATZ80242.1 putative adenine specific DNA methyltransferase [Bodo saltans virus]